MFQVIAVKHLRTGAWLVAGGGILSSFVFHGRFYGSLFDGDVLPPHFVTDILPYFIIAIAATINRTLALAWISLIASFTVLAISVYTYFDLIRTPDMINDIELYSDGQKWIIALVVLVVVISGFICSKIQNRLENLH